MKVNRRLVCHWCSYYILIYSVIRHWTDAYHYGSYSFYTINRKRKWQYLDYPRICAKSLRIRFILASSFLLFPTFKQFMPNFLRGWSSPQRITRKHIENFRSVLAIIRNDNFFYHFFLFRHFQVGKNGFVLVFLCTFFCTFFKAVTCLIWNNLANMFKTACNVEQNKENKFPMSPPKYIDYGQRPITARSIHHIV